MSATQSLKENWFYAEAALKSTSLAPFAAKPASQFRHFQREVSLAYFNMRSEAKEKIQFSEPAALAEAIPLFKTIPLGDNHQRHALLNVPTSTLSPTSAEKYDEWNPFPMPVIAWTSPPPTPNIDDANDLSLSRTPPTKSHHMDGLFSPCSITAPSSPPPSPSPRRSVSSDDTNPRNRISLRQSSARAVKSSVAVSEDNRPKLRDKDEAAFDGHWQRNKSIGPRTPLGPSLQFLNHPVADTAPKQPALMVSYDKYWQLEQVIDVIVDSLMDRENRWAPMAQLWREVREIEPSLTQSWIKLAFRDNAVLQQTETVDGRMCAYAPSSDTDYYGRRERIRTRRAARIARK
ncbi:hypothetical protein BD410DRAFT_895332 [Rickenella mellea]|uniref:Uncharacterized protein n=1 Tax=Rickenella mellea TaxID=50990 RepID=A0A4Y7QHI4_9AGAM|nr:hypothetical protein BD410DRAFT_895332 [Rickenella mellea]